LRANLAYPVPKIFALIDERDALRKENRKLKKTLEGMSEVKK
jgi:hypothetical protein